MPLTSTQRLVAKVLGPLRTEHSYVAGGAALNHAWPRLSDDMDIFDDRRGQLPGCVEPELQALRDAGFSVEITAQDEWVVEAILQIYGHETKVQWLDDPETCRRFFPARHDDELGFRLHRADMAVNKVLCASRRREAPRDAVDLVTIVSRYSPLGPLVWAAVGKTPALSPLRVIQDIRGIVFGYANEEIVAVRTEGENPMTRAELRGVLEPALDDAYDYCEAVAPIEYTGCLFIGDDERPTEADAETIANGKARVMPLRDFGVTLITGD